MKSLMRFLLATVFLVGMQSMVGYSTPDHDQSAQHSEILDDVGIEFTYVSMDLEMEVDYLCSADHPESAAEVLPEMKVEGPRIMHLTKHRKRGVFNPLSGISRCNSPPESNG